MSAEGIEVSKPLEEALSNFLKEQILRAAVTEGEIFTFQIQTHKHSHDDRKGHYGTVTFRFQTTNA